MYPTINYVGAKEITQLTLDVYPGVCEYHHFQDNGEDYDYQKGIYKDCIALLDR